MSFFGELVGSIGGERAPAPPERSLSGPVGTNPNQAKSSKSAPPTPSAGSAPVRPVYKGTAKLGAPAQSSGLKRKAEEISTERPVKLSKPNPSLQTDRNGQKSNKLNGSATVSPTTTKPAKVLSTIQAPQNPVGGVAKAPAKGSYAEIMARAKQAQSSKTASGLGTIKHQTTEKIKHSKLAERKKEDLQKGKMAIPAAGQNGRTTLTGKVDPRRRSASPTKKGEQARLKIPKAPSGPLHGPPQAKSAAPAYKGTIGQAPKKPREEMRKKKSSRYDDYLGTDEEEDDFIEDDDGYGYGRDEPDYSDASSDMEGGFDDVEKEERMALKAAKDDDQRELELETRLRKEKQARLAALARKNRK